MSTLKLVERSKVPDLPKNPSSMEVIELDYYIDSYPINKRLPKFEIAILNLVEKDIFAEAKIIYDQEQANSQKKELPKEE